MELQEHHEGVNLRKFIGTTSYFRLGNGWAGITHVKPPREKYWVKGESIDDCKEKLLERYYYAP